MCWQGRHQLPVLESYTSFAALSEGAAQPVGYVVAPFAVSCEPVPGQDQDTFTGLPARDKPEEGTWGGEEGEVVVCGVDSGVCG